MRDDNDQLRRCRIIIGSSLSVGLLTLGLSFARLSAEGSESFLGWFFVAVSFVMLSSPLVLKLTQSVFLSGSLIPATGAGTLIFMAVFEGGLESEAIYWYSFAPLIAAFFVNAFASVFFGVLMLFALLLIYFLHQSGMITPSPHPIEVQHFLKLMSATAAVIFGASVAWLYETNRRKSEAAIHRSNSKTEAIISAIPDVMFLLNQEGKILELKTAAVTDFFNTQLSVAVKKHKSIFDLFNAHDRERITAQLQRTGTASSIQLEEYELDKAGEQLSLEVRMVPTHMNEVLTIIRDVTKERGIERLKNEFLSTVSHELRTPLTAIIGYLGILSGGVIPAIPKEANEMLENTNRNAKRLSFLIDDLLDLQKISSGQIQYNMKNVGLETFIKQTIELNQGYASKYNVQLIYNIQTDIKTLYIDENRMHQVMANLLSNAIKYSPTGDKVSVMVKEVNHQLIISVTDNGEGIPETFRNQVFEKFTQSDSSNTRKAGGTGLGLSISKMIIEAHHGSINFESRVGTGTTFNIFLPLSAD